MDHFKYHRLAFYLFEDSNPAGHVLRALAWHADRSGAVTLALADVCEAIDGQISREQIEQSLVFLRDHSLLTYQGDAASFAYDVPTAYTLDITAMKAWPAHYQPAV